MLNQLVLVGKLFSFTEGGIIIEIAEPKAKLPVILSESMLKLVRTNSQMEIGDLIGIKGRLDVNNKGQIVINCEKITFLSSRKEEE